jgi:hypothetical protein
MSVGEVLPVFSLISLPQSDPAEAVEEDGDEDSKFITTVTLKRANAEEENEFIKYAFQFPFPCKAASLNPIVPEYTPIAR